MAKRLALLQAADRSVADKISALHARYSYFVHCSAPLDAEEKLRLGALLVSGEGPPEFPRGAVQLFAVPRAGTISPWSSKATDIAHACGFDKVLRLERGICYGIESIEPLPLESLYRAGVALMDRMTETLIANAEPAQQLFASQPSRALESV
ncbi:MAG: phosphoribosylformylglycinamidine synthase, partial [Woeseiaceae bacterium]